MKSYLCILAIFYSITAVSALYFHIAETERKCFIEEIPDETMVVGHYKVEVFDANVRDFLPTPLGFGMLVSVFDPEKNTVLSRTYAASGRFTFTSHSAGEHTICLHSNSTAWFGGGQLRVTFSLLVDEDAFDYAEMSEKEQLTAIELQTKKLLDKAIGIRKEQDFQRYREERFRQTSESTNQRVLWWSIAQTLILLITGFWQMRHLKSFFEAKKLV